MLVYNPRPLNARDCRNLPKVDLKRWRRSKPDRFTRLLVAPSLVGLQPPFLPHLKALLTFLGPTQQLLNLDRSESLRVLMLRSAGTGVLMSSGGLMLAILLDLPPGPLIGVLCVLLLFWPHN